MVQGDIRPVKYGLLANKFTFIDGRGQCSEVFAYRTCSLANLSATCRETGRGCLQLPCLRTGVVHLSAAKQKWGLADSAHCEGRDLTQTVEHIITGCPEHQLRTWPKWPGWWHALKTYTRGSWAKQDSKSSYCVTNHTFGQTSFWNRFFSFSCETRLD